MELKGLFDFLKRWADRGVQVRHYDSTHRRATHAGRYTRATRIQRKTRRKMAQASRRRNARTR